jgi:hypothetical protein
MFLKAFGGWVFLSHQVGKKWEDFFVKVWYNAIIRNGQGDGAQAAKPFLCFICTPHPSALWAATFSLGRRLFGVLERRA